MPVVTHPHTLLSYTRNGVPSLILPLERPSELWHLIRARYYEPSTGRFISQDPYKGDRKIPMTLNPYLYCLNNPIRFTDPSGLISEDPPLMTPEDEDNPDFCAGYKKGMKFVGGAIVFLIGNLIILIPTGGSGPIVAGSILAGAGGPTFCLSGTLSATEIATLTGGLTLSGIGAMLMGSSSSGGGGDDGATAKKLAKKWNMDINNEKTQTFIRDRNLTVENFAGKYLKGDIKGAIPGEFEKLTIEKALNSGNTTIRKLLTNNRFWK